MTQDRSSDEKEPVVIEEIEYRFKNECGVPIKMGVRHGPDGVLEITVASASSATRLSTHNEYSLWKALTMLTNGSAFDLTDSPKSFVGNVKRLLAEWQAAHGVEDV